MHQNDFFYMLYMCFVCFYEIFGKEISMSFIRFFVQMLIKPLIPIIPKKGHMQVASVLVEKQEKYQYFWIEKSIL